MLVTELLDWSFLVRRAYSGPDWEPIPDSLLYPGLDSLGVSSAQDLRDMGREAADIRSLASYFAAQIKVFGDPEHLDCARILDGVAAVLAPWTG